MEGEREQSAEGLYGELRRLARQAMRRERADHTLQPTALANEAYLKIAKAKGVEARRSFLARATPAMKQILVDHARRRLAQKRGAGAQREELVESARFDWDDPTTVLALHEALQVLGQSHPRVRQVVELRFIGGLTVAETAKELGVGRDTIMDEWKFGRAWLNRRLTLDE